jgi:hypothetical protein
MDRHRRCAGHETTLACARGRAEARRVCRADGSAANTAESSGTCCATVTAWSRDAARLLLQAAEYDRIRRSAPQPLPIADWVGLQLYDSAQQVSSA